MLVSAETLIKALEALSMQRCSPSKLEPWTKPARGVGGRSCGCCRARWRERAGSFGAVGMNLANQRDRGEIRDTYTCIEQRTTTLPWARKSSVLDTAGVDCQDRYVDWQWLPYSTSYIHSTTHPRDNILVQQDYHTPFCLLGGHFRRGVAHS